MKIEKTDRRITVVTDGDFDLQICPELKALLEEDLKDNRVTHVCFDLRRTSFIDSSGLGLILWIYKQTAPYGGKVSVINADDNAAKLFAVAGLDHLLNLRRRGREKLG
ncbi:MAG: anti-sigma factor antagonist [Bacillota bacterium]|jgi:stage II sporulation protein AA (anti-sigma F factor antagonist)